MMITIALVGIGGYGNSYVSALLDAPDQDGFRFVGAIDPSPSACRRLNELKGAGVGIYPSLDAFHAATRADLIIICTPLHLHAPQTCQALAHGSHVLCEKPLCVTPDEIGQMIQARDEADKLVAIGYQWSFSAAIQQLKAHILAGDFGAPRRLKSLVLWPRDEVYYHRNRWAGAVRDDQGRLILDSPVNNACAHYLHNLLYLLGPASDRSALPRRLTAELYRAHPIENYDTAALRAEMPGGAELLFVVSHATAAADGPVFQMEFERATVNYAHGQGDSAIVARFIDGSIRNYGSPNEQRHRKLWQTLSDLRENATTLCGIEAASAHMRCAFAAQSSGGNPIALPDSLIQVIGPVGARRTSVRGLDEILHRCYDNYALPSELGVEWARSTTSVELAPYQELDQ